MIYTIPLANGDSEDRERAGERVFNDATLCHQAWQSCATCHPDGRADGLNWDLLNDGIGNPKNTKSLLLATQTPPAMSLGGRATASAAIRAGFRHILFSSQSEDVVGTVGTYLVSLKPVPSPYLVQGRLSSAARRGRRIFAQGGCIMCHPPGLFTDQNSYDVGTAGPSDKQSDKFDTSSLVELWRTAPYLHDGSAKSILDVLTTKNQADKHGTTSRLSTGQLNDLTIYLLSL
jgi:cytochrome c peroxidase